MALAAGTQHDKTRNEALLLLPSPNAPIAAARGLAGVVRALQPRHDAPDTFRSIRLPENAKTNKSNNVRSSGCDKNIFIKTKDTKILKNHCARGSHNQHRTKLHMHNVDKRPLRARLLWLAICWEWFSNSPRSVQETSAIREAAWLDQWSATQSAKRTKLVDTFLGTVPSLPSDPSASSDCF